MNGITGLQRAIETIQWGEKSIPQSKRNINFPQLTRLPETPSTMNKATIYAAKEAGINGFLKFFAGLLKK